MFTFLPTELWNAIFRHVERKDLTTLARVSRLFQEEAEHVLYHHVDLRETTDGARLASWCMSVICDRRRASRVHTLLLSRRLGPPRGDLEHSSTEIQQLIAQAFKAVVNLKDLRDFGSMVDGLVPIVVRSTFEDCTFRLTRMSGPFIGLTVDAMWKFLSTQPNISYWEPSFRFLKSISAVPPNMLPSVRGMLLIRPEKLPLFHGRPIQKLVLKFHDVEHTKHDGLAVIHSLRRFKATLRALSYIAFNPLTDWTSSDIIRSLSQNAPNLEMLTLDIHFHRVSTDEQKDIVEAISGFKHLHSFSINLRMASLHDPNPNPPDPSNPLEHDPIWTPNSPSQSRKVASMFMESCPSLRRISFPLKDWTDGEGKVDLCYRRLWSGGQTIGRAEAWLEGFYEIDSTWWM